MESPDKTYMDGVKECIQVLEDFKNDKFVDNFEVDSCIYVIKKHFNISTIRED